MQVKLKVVISQQNLSPEYSGEFTIISKRMKVNKVFAFVFRQESNYRISGGQPSDFEQLIKLTKGKRLFVEVVGKITRDNVPDMTPEQHIILGLFLQMFDFAKKKLSSEHGLNTQTPSSEALKKAGNSTIQSEVEANIDVPDLPTRKVIVTACA